MLRKGGQAIGVGAGQQSRIHCTRLAGNKADIWYLRQHPKVMNLSFVDNIRRPDRDNTIDVYISDDYEDVLADGIWQQFFKTKPEPLTKEEKRLGLQHLTVFHSVLTHSSHSVTTLKEQSVQVLSLLHSLAVQFVMIMLLKPAISTI